ncbi:hypothetical protein H8356DRAFT_1337957 [Neocallimastix lanati (nom. inval.)]|nr:hypothetical protein H8356DRAFT_1337957 [Neocallimastix sp. JGI-2020a]
MPEYLNKRNKINGDNIVNNNDNNNNNNNNNTDITTEETNNAVIISLYDTSVLALVTIIGFILIKKNIYVKRSLNYVSPKPNYPVVKILQNNYQSQVSYPISSSDVPCLSRDLHRDLQRDLPKESPPYDNQEDLLITRHVA